MNDDGFRRLDEQFYAVLDDIYSWLKSRGITQRNRLRVYKANLARLAELERSQSRKQTYAEIAAAGLLTEILSTFVDSMEIVDSLPTLRTNEIDIPNKLLRTALSGPADAFKEDHKSNQGRNAMFELSMGAMIARAGLRPTFRLTNPDIAFQMDGRSIKIECKRVISESQLFNRIEEGIEQLSKSVRRNTTDIGIVAVSLTRLFNRGDIVLVGSEPHDILSRELHATLKSMELRLAALTKPSVSAILFYLSSPFYVRDKGYTSAACGTVFPMNLAEKSFLEKLCSLLKLRS